MKGTSRILRTRFETVSLWRLFEPLLVLKVRLKDSFQLRSFRIWSASKSFVYGKQNEKVRAIARFPVFTRRLFQVLELV